MIPEVRESNQAGNMAPYIEPAPNITNHVPASANRPRPREREQEQADGTRESATPQAGDPEERRSESEHEERRHEYHTERGDHDDRYRNDRQGVTQRSPHEEYKDGDHGECDERDAGACQSRCPVGHSRVQPEHPHPRENHSEESSYSGQHLPGRTRECRQHHQQCREEQQSTSSEERRYTPPGD